MNREEIRQLLPHREPMLLLDEVELRGEEAAGRYLVRGDEFFLQGHFPGRPMVPGVILCEILAQSACVLLSGALTGKELPVYTGLDKVRFRAPVLPGDVVEAKCRLKRAKPPFYFAEGSILVGDKICVSAEFSFAITGV